MAEIVKKRKAREMNGGAGDHKEPNSKAKRTSDKRGGNTHCQYLLKHM